VCWVRCRLEWGCPSAAEAGEELRQSTASPALAVTVVPRSILADTAKAPPTLPPSPPALNTPTHPNPLIPTPSLNPLTPSTPPQPQTPRCSTPARCPPSSPQAPSPTSRPSLSTASAPRRGRPTWGARTTRWSTRCCCSRSRRWMRTGSRCQRWGGLGVGVGGRGIDSRVPARGGRVLSGLGVLSGGVGEGVMGGAGKGRSVGLLAGPLQLFATESSSRIFHAHPQTTIAPHTHKTTHTTAQLPTPPKPANRHPPTSSHHPQQGTKVSRGYYADNGPPTTLSGTGRDVSLSYQGFSALDNVQFVNGNQLGRRLLLQVRGRCGGVVVLCGAAVISASNPNPPTLQTKPNPSCKPTTTPTAKPTPKPTTARNHHNPPPKQPPP